MKRENFVMWLLLGAVAGAALTYAAVRDVQYTCGPVQASTAATAGGGDNAIARFGLAPVNPQWFELRDKDNRVLESIPAPDRALFDFPVAPVVEKHTEPDGRDHWTVTFKP